MKKEIESTEEEKLTLKSLKKEFDLFKQEIFSRLPVQPLPPVHSITENIDAVVIPDEPAESLIRFHLTDKVNPIREFSEESNGERWREVANEFHNTNIDKIRSREDL